MTNRNSKIKKVTRFPISADDLPVMRNTSAVSTRKINVEMRFFFFETNLCGICLLVCCSGV